MKPYVLLIFFVLLMLIMSRAHAETEWKESTYVLHEQVMSLGVDEDLSVHIIDRCKETAEDANKCVRTTVAIYGNESSFGARCKAFSCWGWTSYSFDSIKDASDAFIARYNMLWYKHDGGGFFYGGNGWLGRSSYCTSEESSNTAVGCPNGAKTFNYFFNILS